MANKIQKTTRDTDFNFEKDIQTSTISSIASYNTSKEFRNVRLLNLEDGIKVTGEKIINHANDNRIMQDLVDEDISINTSMISAQNSYKVYGSPFKEILNNRQHYNNCGVESMLNNLAMAGIIKMKNDLSDQKTVEKSFLQTVWKMGLANDDGVIGTLDEDDGGTLPDYYKEIFAYFNIKSNSYYFKRNCDYTQFSDLNELGYKISQGYGAVVGVCSSKLWQEKYAKTSELAIDHAIAITGVVYNDNTPPAQIDENGNITSYNTPIGFYIHDSGAWMSRFISIEEFKEVTLYEYHGMNADEKDEYYNYDEGVTYDPDKYLKNLREFDTSERDYIGKQPQGIAITITSEPIKNNLYNLNANGDKNDNIIWGNNSDNKINGMAGNDTLYGNAGNDEIKGGAGNDIIIANNLSDSAKEYLINTTGINLDNIDTSETIQKGFNSLYGDSGNDIILGGNGADLIYGGSGNDFIWTSDGRNVAQGGAGNDYILGGYNDDRLLGNAGNDTIYGLNGDDILFGDTGNDVLFAGRGDDRIETGTGTDIVYIEGQLHGHDTISSQGGKTTIKFTNETNGDEIISKGAKISDMYFHLVPNEDKTNYYNFNISYQEDDENVHDKIEFQQICTKNAGVLKNLHLVDAQDMEYTVKVVKSKTIKTNNNNILFSLNDKTTVISTGNGNDIVTMLGYGSVRQTYNTRIDKITYTNGVDKYYSHEGDTYYTVSGFGSGTTLSIYDYVKAPAGYEFDNEENITEYNDIVSKDDRLYLDCDKNSLGFFFDVGINGVNTTTTDVGGFYILDKKNVSYDKLISIAYNRDVYGSVYIDSFLGDKKEFKDDEFYGNGRIEKIYYDKNKEYEDFSVDIIQIATDVASWLANEDYNTENYETAFEAFKNFNELSTQAQLALVDCYNYEVI